MPSLPSPPNTPPAAAKSAHQHRSHQTLNRILNAAEELLEAREFDELTIAELAKRAKDQWTWWADELNKAPKDFFAKGCGWPTEGKK